MPFLAPLALAGLVFVPLVVAMYLLKLRRDEAVVPSTLLWQRLVADVEANAPWQRLRRSLLLLLQLLLVAAARGPRGAAVHRAAGRASRATSSWSSTRRPRCRPTDVDAEPARGGEGGGGRRAQGPAGGRQGQRDRGGPDRPGGRERHGRPRPGPAGDRRRSTPTTDVGDLGDALRLASALAARSGDAEILVATDAALATPPDRLRPRRRSGSCRWAATPATRRSSRSRSGPRRAACRTARSSRSPTSASSSSSAGQLFADGQLRDSRTLTLDPQRRTDVSIDDIDDPQHPASVIEVRLLGADGASDPARRTRSAVDDRAWAVVPPKELRQVLLVGDAGPVPRDRAELTCPTPSSTSATATTGRRSTRLDQFELVIFNRFLPPTLPAKPTLAIAPPRTSALGTVTGTLTNPGIGTLDPADPILRYVDLSTVHVGEAQKLELPAWARAVIPGPAASPLLYAGALDGPPAAVLAFEPRHSDLPLQVAFPVLLANLAGELMGGSDDAGRRRRPRRPGHPAGARGRARACAWSGPTAASTSWSPRRRAPRA